MIENKTKRQLPDYIESSLEEICQKAGVGADGVTLVIKNRNRYTGDCWTWKGNTNSVSGSYKLDGKTVIIRLGRKSHIKDIRFVIAHEIGHLKQHRESGGDLYCRPTEHYANKFALLTCNCYPKAKYKISRVNP